jgi:hypothetical protein
MRSTAKAQVRPGPRDLRRNPFFCLVMTTMLAGTVWAGMVWVAGQIQP